MYIHWSVDIPASRHWALARLHLLQSRDLWDVHVKTAMLCWCSRGHELCCHSMWTWAWPTSALQLTSSSLCSALLTPAYPHALSVTTQHKAAFKWRVQFARTKIRYTSRTDENIHIHRNLSVSVPYTQQIHRQYCTRVDPLWICACSQSTQHSGSGQIESSLILVDSCVWMCSYKSSWSIKCIHIGSTTRCCPNMCVLRAQCEWHGLYWSGERVLALHGKPISELPSITCYMGSLNTGERTPP